MQVIDGRFVTCYGNRDAYNTQDRHRIQGSPLRALVLKCGGGFRQDWTPDHVEVFSRERTQKCTCNADGDLLSSFLQGSFHCLCISGDHDVPHRRFLSSPVPVCIASHSASW